MNRIYIFTGKGGVGKTSCAAAHALKSAKEGIPTLLVSTDMAHNLADLFEVRLEKEPMLVCENLEVLEIDPDYVRETDFTEMSQCLTKLLPQTKEMDMEEFGLLPGMDELFSLLKIKELYQTNKYQRIIVDCAPTGETLSLLKLPELLSWYMEKFFPLGKAAMRVISPVAKKIYKVELPGKQAMNDIERFYQKLFELQELLKDRECTSIRLVTLPEKMVVEETKRNYMYMNLYNFNVDGIYINRLLPSDIENPFFAEWLQLQKKYKKEIIECFQALPIYEIPWYDEELKGMKAVNRICEDALGEDVFAIKEITKKECFVENDKGYVLKVKVPFVDKSEISLYQAQTDVVIKIGNFKRNIPLPNVFRSYVITSAKMEQEELVLQFEKEEIH
ncbi:MAG TPA: ArsA family ATPase [Lachnospiraceae bacterium]|nr:ArsA family ATPase [Lachnospiraceae bacterium]